MESTQNSARYPIVISLRVTPQEKKRLEEQASIAGLSVSEYMRRNFFGGRPVVAKTDEVMVRELRRVGGLVKHNFETLRQAGGNEECYDNMSEVLRVLRGTIERVAGAWAEKRKP